MSDSPISVLQVGIDLGSLFNLVTYALFFVFIVYGQRIQYYVTLNGIGRSLNRLKAMKDRAGEETTDYFASNGRPEGELTERINQFFEYVTIMPESLDPNGIVGKIEHIARTSDRRVKGEVQSLLRDASPLKVSVATNLLEIATALNMIHKVVRHYYLSSKKTNSYLTLVQLQMNLPQILEQADALLKATEAFRLVQPIGDGAGALIAFKFMAGTPNRKVAEDTVLGIREHRGRTVYVIKAEGPMGYVGEPGVAVQRIVEEMGVPLSAIIMVDAALKLEGERTGEIAEGVGAAIGGLGVEKFQIEEVASKHRIPLYAVLIKESEVEAITAMKKEVAQAAEIAANVIGRVIEEKTKEGDRILLIGIGNTLGIGQ